MSNESTTPPSISSVSSGSSVKRNILANVLGGGWTTALSLLAIPVQIKLLGADAYGLIGFVVSLQMIVTVLDFGLATTLSRELAGDNSPNHQATHRLIRLSLANYWIVAAVFGIGLFVSADWIAVHWLSSKAIAPESIAAALRLLAIWVAFSWPITLYSNILIGLHRLEVVNLLQVVAQTLSLGGGVLLIILKPDLQLYLIWIAANAVFASILFLVVCLRYLPGLSLWPYFSFNTISGIWRYSLDMNLIAIATLAYTQADRLLISNLLSLNMLGYYNAAYNLSRGINLIQGYFGSAMFPRLAADDKLEGKETLRRRYQKYSQVLMYIVSLPAFILIFFGYEILRVWTTPENAGNAHGALILLAIGYLFNSAMSPAYILAVATGRSRLPLWVNWLGLFIYLPCLYFAISQFGIVGAGLMWALLNLYYMLTLIPLTQRRILSESISTWFRANLLPFSLVGAGVFGIGHAAFTLLHTDNLIITAIVGLILTGLYAIAGFIMLEPSLRSDVQRTISGIISRFIRRAAPVSES